VIGFKYLPAAVTLVLVLLVSVNCAQKEDAPSRPGTLPEVLPTCSQLESVVESFGATEAFVTVRLIGDIMPTARQGQFADPIAVTLAKEKLGAVPIGGGSGLAPAGGVRYAEFPVDLNNARRGLDVLRAELRRLAAPDGSSIHVQQREMTADVCVW